MNPPVQSKDGAGEDVIQQQPKASEIGARAVDHRNKKANVKEVEPLEVHLFRLCEYVRKLQARNDSGQETAVRVWNNLVDALAAGLPADFFYGRVYFWNVDSTLTEDEWAFFDLLEEASMVKKQYFDKEGSSEEEESESGDDSGEENREVTKEGENNGEEGPGEQSKPQSQPKRPATPGTALGEEEEAPHPPKTGEERLRDLLAAMRIAKARLTDMTLNWKKEDEELKEEIGDLRKKLKESIEVFEEMKTFMDCLTLIEKGKAGQGATLHGKMSLEDIRKVLKQMRGEKCYTPSVSSCECSCCSSDDDEDDDDISNQVETVDEDYTSDSGEDDDDMSHVSDSLGPPPLSDEDDEEKMLERERDEAIASGKMIKMYGRPFMKPPIRPCTHIGCPPPIAHYRDWRKEDYRCVCSTVRYRHKEFLERHVREMKATIQLRCDQCYYSTNRECCLDKHKKDKHEELRLKTSRWRVHECPRGCKRLFPSKCGMIQHQIQTGRQCRYPNANSLPELSFSKKSVPYMVEVQQMLQRVLDSTKEKLAGIRRKKGILARISESEEEGTEEREEERKE